MNKKIHDSEWIIIHQPNPFVTNSDGLPFPIQYDSNLTIAKEWMEAAGYSYEVIILETNSSLMIVLICLVLIFKFTKNRASRRKR